MRATKLCLVCAALAALAVLWLPAAPLRAVDMGELYQTPEHCPRFAKPQFISRPLTVAYPGMEYNIRPAIKGGTYPYTFSLSKAPQGMNIDPAKGTVTWTPPDAEGKAFDVEIKVTDAAGRSATQAFSITVTRKLFFFVAPDGDDANPGTIDKPWKTVLRAADPPEGFTYPPGAVVVFRGGEYKVHRPSEKNKLGGNVVPISDRSPRYWLAYPGERPVIDLGWSGELQRAAHEEQKASGKLRGGGKEPSTQGYGHRFALVRGSDYFYMDGFEIKNACYYMFVMWDGRNTIHIRRCNLHHLWADWAENPSFIFTFAGERKGDFNAWGVRPKTTHYTNFVVQENYFHDRFYVRERGSHGGGMVFYTVHNAVVEDNVFERIFRGQCINDKDNGFGNTYRNNVMRGGFAISGQWNCDEIEVCHNYVEGEMRIGHQPGWLRNIWVHHNTIRGEVALMAGGTKVPEKLDEQAGDFSRANTADSAKAIREFPVERKLVHFYGNVLDAAGGEGRDANVVLRLPNNKNFAERWRYVRWDENLVDSEARIELLWNRFVDFSVMTAAGFDAHGARAKIDVDSEGRLPAGSDYAKKYGRFARPL